MPASNPAATPAAPRGAVISAAEARHSQTLTVAFRPTSPSRSGNSPFRDLPRRSPARLLDAALTDKRSQTSAQMGRSVPSEAPNRNTSRRQVAPCRGEHSIVRRPEVATFSAVRPVASIIGIAYYRAARLPSRTAPCSFCPAIDPERGSGVAPDRPRRSCMTPTSNSNASKYRRPFPARNISLTRRQADRRVSKRQPLWRSLTPEILTTPSQRFRKNENPS